MPGTTFGFRLTPPVCTFGPSPELLPARSGGKMTQSFPRRVPKARSWGPLTTSHSRPARVGTGVCTIGGAKGFAFQTSTLSASEGVFPHQASLCPRTSPPLGPPSPAPTGGVKRLSVGRHNRTPAAVPGGKPIHRHFLCHKHALGFPPKGAPWPDRGWVIASPSQTNPMVSSLHMPRLPTDPAPQVSGIHWRGVLLPPSTLTPGLDLLKSHFGGTPCDPRFGSLTWANHPLVFFPHRRIDCPQTTLPPCLHLADPQASWPLIPFGR